MKIFVRRLGAFTLVSRSSLIGLAGEAMAQGYMFNQLSELQALYPNFSASAIAQGDFNGDGRLDFAVSASGTVNSMQTYYVETTSPKATEHMHSLGVTSTGRPAR